MAYGNPSPPIYNPQNQVDILTSSGGNKPRGGGGAPPIWNGDKPSQGGGGVGAPAPGLPPVVTPAPQRPYSNPLANGGFMQRYLAGKGGGMNAGASTLPAPVVRRPSMGGGAQRADPRMRGIFRDARVNPDGSVSGRNDNNEFDQWKPGMGQRPPMGGPGSRPFERGPGFAMGEPTPGRPYGSWQPGGGSKSEPQFTGGAGPSGYPDWFEAGISQYGMNPEQAAAAWAATGQPPVGGGAPQPQPSMDDPAQRAGGRQPLRPGMQYRPGGGQRPIGGGGIRAMPVGAPQPPLTDGGYQAGHYQQPPSLSPEQWASVAGQNPYQRFDPGFYGGFNF